ncbi:hypothetical protein [Acidovorax sp. NCPPB 4044]|uniref:hypothetical protein n=1 Tax=Acidovorax sp. NCPPB 4044 TaxID=2940490 RepID=UPI00230225C1|nr:hypothetical protein [Acidovorax sp. NCPPB 4044]MDA8523751.1 hypothetical protein [Acidovorax sp. NCPPB 4044]
MLDASFHQGASLLGLMPESQLRMVAILAQPDAAYGLETLFQVCSALQRMGYPVAVLDGTARETDAAPGLAHLLAAPSWQHGAPLDTGGAAAASLAVLPAAYGLRRLARQSVDAFAAQQTLQPFFRAYSVLAVYAPAETLAPLVRETSAVPLLIAEGGDHAVQSYRQLKHMAMHAGVPCTVASVVPTDRPASFARAHAVLAALQRCAERHLGSELHTTTLRANHPQDLQRLALQLLENAGTIGAAQVPAAPPFIAPQHTPQFARSH